MKPLATLCGYFYIQDIKVLNLYIGAAIIRTKKPTSLYGSNSHPFYAIGCLVLFLLFTRTVVPQTTVVIKMNPRDIVIAADSQQSMTSYETDVFGIHHTTDTVSYTCKIISDGKRAFAIAGYTGIPDYGMHNKEIRDIGLKALHGNHRLDNVGKVFASEMSLLL